MQLNFPVFEKVKLSNYIPLNELETVSSYEYYDKWWDGETLGFTYVLQSPDDLQATTCVVLDLQDSVFTSIYEGILTEIGIPLKRGSTLHDVQSYIKINPFNIKRRAEGKTQYEYLLDNCYLSTLLFEGIGLVYIIIITDKRVISSIIPS